MRHSRLCFLTLVVVAVFAPLMLAGVRMSQASKSTDTGQQAEEPPDPQRVAYQTFIKHLRANFEDIHEVSMRFHNIDPTLNGMMVVEMAWADGRLQSARVVENETNEEEAEAILEVLRRWRIEELAGPATFTVPFRFRIVGSDDPTYPEKGILTGSVKGPEGGALSGALIELLPRSEELEPLRARANREGVFVRTLIPPGTWDVHCTAAGFDPGKVESLEIERGEHRVVDFELEPAKSSR